MTGASRGIGAATARRLAADGYAVCVNFLRDASSAARVVDEIRALGQIATAMQTDVADEAQVAHLFAAAENELGPIRVLVNNAGIVQQQMRVDSMSAERINRILSTNVTGCLLCCKQAVLRMSTQRGGSGGAIVNVSSAAARIGSPNEYVDYAASKAAVDALTRGLALEVAAEGIRVNCVRPGFIDTDMHASGGEPGRLQRLQSSIPMQRGGQPDEVANAIAWLVSEQASYSTGAFLDVAGGR